MVARLTVRMERLIDDLREYSRIERRETDGEKISAQEAVAHVEEELQGFIREHKATLAVQGKLPDQPFSSAPLTTIFRNLISNGIKYNDAKEKRINISGRAEGDMAIFSVQDNGIGISPEFGDRVFDMFRRLHGEDQYGGGTGAGLAIVKRGIEQAGGWIHFEPAEGGGTVFHFGLPMKNGNGDG